MSQEGKLLKEAEEAGKLTTPVLKKIIQFWDIFGPNSWLILNHFSIGINGKSLIVKLIPQWESDKDYAMLKNVVKNMYLTYDAAEKGILLAKEMRRSV